MVNFKQAVSSKTFVTWKDQKAGFTIEGVLKEAKKGQFGLQYYFQTKDGLVVCDAVGKLKWLVESNDCMGKICKVIYKGREVAVIQGKKSSVHQFELFIAEDSDAVDDEI